ncbi:hypothetical protein [Alteromonas flava]|uniref:hypothetical protein n=1 Tax=Alteromonas flava TaxID=2048003 RepID=UPI000C28DBF5|nr:hypothetical protein [Alteromonas flava]
MVVVLLLLSALSSLFYYVNAFKSGLNAKAWAFVGLVLGPFALPMFSISKHVAWRRAVGFGNARLLA